MVNSDTCPRPTTYVGNSWGTRGDLVGNYVGNSWGRRQVGNAAAVGNHDANTYAGWGLCFARYIVDERAGENIKRICAINYAAYACCIMDLDTHTSGCALTMDSGSPLCAPPTVRHGVTQQIHALISTQQVVYCLHSRHALPQAAPKCRPKSIGNPAPGPLYGNPWPTGAGRGA